MTRNQVRLHPQIHGGRKPIFNDELSVYTIQLGPNNYTMIYQKLHELFILDCTPPPSQTKKERKENSKFFTDEIAYDEQV